MTVFFYLIISLSALASEPHSSINTLKTTCVGNDIFQAIQMHNELCLNSSFKKMNINEVNINGYTPLHFAIQERNAKAILLLLKKGADINKIDFHGRTPSELAKELGYHSLYQYFRKIEWETKRLFDAIDSGDLNAVRFSLQRGAAIGARDNRLDTVLHLAAQSNFAEICALLISKGANVNAKNYLGETPLHVASMRGFLQTVQTLILSGANLNILDERRESPLDVALTRGQDEVAKTLGKFKAHEGNRMDFNLTD